MYKSVLSLSINGIQHRARASYSTQENLGQHLLNPSIYIRSLRPRKTEEPEASEERGRVAQDGVPFQKVCKGLCTGDIMGRDGQAGEPREGKERGEREGGGREGVVEEDPMGDCRSGGEGVEGGFEKGQTGARLAGQGGRGSGEEVERLCGGHPPWEGLPEGDPVRMEGEGGHDAWNGEAEDDGDEDGLDLALGEGCGATLWVIADGVGEEEGDEVAKRGDHARALELVGGANKKVGYEDGAIGACALDDEGEDDGGELDEEVDGVGVRGRVEDDGEEVDEYAEDLVGYCQSGVW